MEGKKIVLELNEKQFQSLKVFLTRTQLSGGEVPAYLELGRIMNEATMGGANGQKNNPEGLKAVEPQSK